MSGIITDFMLLNKPIIFIEPDNEFYGDLSSPLNWENSDISPKLRIGSVVKDLPELLLSISNSIS